jgi:drug resistance transporter, Bcr/CflA subfamily
MPSRAISPASSLYVVMLGLLSALPPFGTDAGLPGLPGLASEFGISTAAATQTLTLFLLGFSIGPMIFGPLSDRYGRKPILLFGVTVFSIAALGCGLARSLDMTLALRFIGGVGAGAAASLPAAIVRDVYADGLALSRQSMVALVNGVAPLVAPLLGAAVLAFGSWRAIHETLAVLGAALFALAALGYAETAPRTAQQRQGSVLAATVASYRAVLSDRNYLLSTALLAATFGVMFAYITGSAGVFMTALGATPTVYGMLFACTAAGTIAGAASNGRLAARYGSRVVLLSAVVANVVIAVVLLLAAIAHAGSIPLCAGLVVASNFCAGIIMPNATHRALRGLGHVAGSAAALQRGLQMVAGSAAGALVGLIGGEPLFAMASVMLLAAIVAFASNRVAPRDASIHC